MLTINETSFFHVSTGKKKLERVKSNLLNNFWGADVPFLPLIDVYTASS